MDSLVPAFIAALLAQSADRTPWLTAILVDRYRRPGTVFLAALAAISTGNALAALAGAFVGPSLNPDARALMLALALLFAGGGALLPLKVPDRLSGWRIGTIATSFLGVLILAFGDAAQFLTFGFAAHGPSAALTAAGATAGCAVALLPAVILGEAGWRKLPLRRIRWTIGGLFLLAGMLALLSAFRII